MNKQKCEYVVYKGMQYIAKNASLEATKRRQQYNDVVLLPVRSKNEANCAPLCDMHGRARNSLPTLNLDTPDDTSSVKLID
jgi:hypothetical protein